MVNGQVGQAQQTDRSRTSLVADDRLDDPPLTPPQRWVLAVADAQAERVAHHLRMAYLFGSTPTRGRSDLDVALRKQQGLARGLKTSGH